MRVNQVYQTLNSLASQLFGSSAPTVTDTTGLRALGNYVIGTSGLDKFMNLFVDRIGKTVVRTVDTRTEFPDLMRNEFEMGAMLAKINLQPIQARSNVAWEITDPAFTPTLLDVNAPNAFVTYFTGVSTWREQQTIPHEPMLNSAFNSAEQMAAFTAGIIKNMNDVNVRNINLAAQGAIASIAVEKALGGSNSYVNLVTLYNSTFTPATPLTAATAKIDPDFYRWSTGIIKLFIEYLELESVLYNEGDGQGNPVARVTYRDNLHVWLNTWYVEYAKRYMQSDVFNADLVSMGTKYKEVKTWQGVGTTLPNYDDTTTIKAIASDGSTVELADVVGMLVDREAIGIGKFNLKTPTFTNPIDQYTNYAINANVMHYVDLSENAIIFALSDPVITAPTP